MPKLLNKSNKLPILYQQGKGGATFTWEVWTEGKTVCTEYGQIDGKKQIAKYDAEPKNTGRANATTPEEQAVTEAKAMWQHKLDRKYSETVAETKTKLLLPMLAHSFAEHPAKAVYPCDVQPKFDGVRCLAMLTKKKVRLLSRSGKEYNVPTIADGLAPYFAKHPKDILDGEIYIHGETLQEINRLVKKVRPESVNLQYYVYDVPTVAGNDSLPWISRADALLHAEKENLWHNVVVVKAQEAKDKNDVRRLQLEYVADMYEGAIIRNRQGKYIFGHRSHDLLKVKSFVDNEFEILAINEGKGKMLGKCVFTCSCDGGEFECTIKASMENRAQIYKDRAFYIGKLLKVKYQYLTEDGIPFLPVGLAIRLDEDI